MKKKIINIDAEFDNFELDEKSIQKYTSGRKASETMKGKTLEELIGVEKAAKGRKTRSEVAVRIRPKNVVKQILKTKIEKGTYNSPNHGMRGKKHQEETKSKQSLKASIRQDLKREHNLGRNDSIPKDILEQAYKKAGL